MAGSALGIAAVLFLLGQLSRRRLACGALLAVIAGNLLCTGASSVLAYCSARFLAGVGIGGEWALAGTYVAEVWPESRRQMGRELAREAPINVSNVLIVCSSCNKHTRLGHNVLPDGTKVRVCKRCGTTLDK